jgi:CPA2 family monovalent cation:H+ antiporter-2
MEHGALTEVLILLATAVVAVAAFRRLALPPVLAYLAVGMLVGPHGLAWIPDTEDTRFLAEFGVVFLLFTLGLEFSLPQLVALRREVLGLRGSQVILTTALAWLGAWLLGMSPEAAFVIGGVLAMSSTAIVIKQMAEQLELNSRHGRNAIGILLFQDIAVLPFLIAIPVLASDSDTSLAAEMGWALVKGLAVVLAMLAVGRWLLRPLFHEIASSRSSELFTLTALLFALTAAAASAGAGLSMALGAFLAGMMLGETESRHQVEADIRPFRDVLLGLFFITVGMLLDVGALPRIWPWVLLLLAALVVLKTASIVAISLLMGQPAGVGLRAGLVLAQGGEFGFALLALGVSFGVLDSSSTQVVLATVVLSMVLTPFLVRYNGLIAKWLFRESYQARLLGGVA